MIRLQNEITEQFSLFSFLMKPEFSGRICDVPGEEGTLKNRMDFRLVGGSLK